MRKLNLRDAMRHDAHFVFVLRNNPVVRQASWSQEPLVWELHKKWFDENYIYYKIINDDWGFIRIKDNDVSIVLKEEYRNQGIGSQILKMVCKDAKFSASIRFDNLSSLYCFLKAGFKPVGFVMEKTGVE